MPTKFTVPPASQKVLLREEELISEMQKHASEAYHDLKTARHEAARDGSASAKVIRELSELSSVEKQMHEQREAIYVALQGLRAAGFITIREEILRPALLKRQERREQLDAEVKGLRIKYPGLDIGYDHTWDSGSLGALRDLCTRREPVSTHTPLADLVSAYTL